MRNLSGVPIDEKVEHCLLQLLVIEEAVGCVGKAVTSKRVGHLTSILVCQPSEEARVIANLLFQMSLHECDLTVHRNKAS
jgi:hypothetical protein